MGLTILEDNAIIKHKISLLKNKETSTKEYRELIAELSTFLCYEAMKNAKLLNTEIETHLYKTKTQILDEKNYVFVPILRSGAIMLNGLYTVIPNAKIGLIGLCHDSQTLNPIKYYYNMPKNIDKKEVLVLDPMLITGSSACDTIKYLKNDGVTRFKFLCIIATKNGIKKLQHKYPETDIYVASIDENLDKLDLVIPRNGDAGNRMFGTE